MESHETRSATLLTIAFTNFFGLVMASGIDVFDLSVQVAYSVVFEKVLNEIYLIQKL